jgi:hypothetical protein
MQRLTITNNNPKGALGSAVLTQTTGLGTDNVKQTVAAELSGGQSIVLSVWPGSRLSMIEKTTPATVIAAVDNSMEVKSAPEEKTSATATTSSAATPTVSTTTVNSGGTVTS